MEGRQGRSFTDDYKRQAVDLVASSGRAIGSVAKELGLRDSVLRRWVELRGAGREATAAAGRPTTEATVCTENLIRVDEAMESPKLAEGSGCSVSFWPSWPRRSSRRYDLKLR